MKTYTHKSWIIVICVLKFTFILAQAPVIEWTNLVGGTGSDFAYAITQNVDGSFVVVGESNSNDGDVTGNHGTNDVWIVKLSQSGNLEWQNSYGGTARDYGHAIDNTSDGGYIVTGYTNSNDFDVSENHGNNDFWVIKLNSLGELQWQKTLGNVDDDYARSIKQTLDGGFIVAGGSYSYNGDHVGMNQFSDFLIVKLDVNGNTSWQQNYGGTFGEEAESIEQTEDGGYIVAGTTFSNDGDVSDNHGNRDIWVVKLSSSGALEWQKALGGSSFDYGKSIVQTNDNGYIVTGKTLSNDGNATGNHGREDILVVKLDAVGNVEWENTYGGSEDDIPSSIQQISDNSCVISATTSSNNGDVTGLKGEEDYWLINIDTSGTINWQKTLGGMSNDFCTSVKQTTDDGFILAGYSRSTEGDVNGTTGTYQYWTVKLSASLSIVENSLDKVNIYPNPVTDFITIYGNSIQELQSIVIYDLNGRTVLTKTFPSSFKNETIDISSLESGNYVIKIDGKNGVTAKRFVKK